MQVACKLEPVFGCESWSQCFIVEVGASVWLCKLEPVFGCLSWSQCLVVQVGATGKTRQTYLGISGQESETSMNMILFFLYLWLG